MKQKKRSTTDALAIMDARWGKTLGWQEGIERERQKFALGELIRRAREARGLTHKSSRTGCHLPEPHLAD